MARPLWLRLFGPNGPTTIGELRDALTSASFGQGIGDGHIARRLLELTGRTEPPIQRPAPADDRPAPDLGLRDTVGGVAREQTGIAAAVAVEHDLRAAAPDTPAAAPAGHEPAADDDAAPLAGEESGRTSIIHVNGLIQPPLAGAPASPFARLDTSAPYMLIGDLQTGLVIDTRNKTLMQGGPGDYPELLAGPNDTIELAGDHSAGIGLAVPAHVEQVLLSAGNDYNLIAGDEVVAAGDRLTINAMPLGAANHVLFDGTAETDGSFLFYGSDAGDVFLGGGGDDLVYGLGGADILSGGGGGDTFAYYDAAHSSGAGYDMLADFDPAADRIDLQVTVAGFDAAIEGGTLSAGSLDADLGAALAGLGAGKAVLFAPDAGDLAGTLFLVVDANGVAGYQEGEDYVFALPATSLADLNAHTDFFI